MPELTELERELLAVAKRALAIEQSVTQGQERELRQGYVDELLRVIAKAESMNGR